MHTKAICKALTFGGIVGMITYAVCRATSRQRRKLKYKAGKMLRSCEGVIDTMSSMLKKCHY